MGYSFDMAGRLACDACGRVGGVRKRTCPYRVQLATGGSLPYCYPSALCADCYRTHKPTLHHGCAEAAAKRTAEEAVRRGRLLAGELEERSAWGPWHPLVPDGCIGLMFVGLHGEEAYRLVSKAEYEQRPRPAYLTDYGDTAREWEPHA